jgi:hypothetical protein
LATTPPPRLQAASDPVPLGEEQQQRLSEDVIEQPRSLFSVSDGLLLSAVTEVELGQLKIVPDMG